MFTANKNSVANKLVMNLKKGQLTINKAPYRKKAPCPRAKELLKLSSSELIDLQEVSITKGTYLLEKGSEFTAFAAKVTSLGGIRKIYQHLKLKYGDATHIMMAYKLEGTHKAYDSDFVDDGEHGAGRRLLALLKNHSDSAIAVFVTRFYGGVHLHN